MRRYKRSRTSGFAANPHPAPSSLPITIGTVKSKTYQAIGFRPDNVMTNAGTLVDTIDKGTADNQRIGSKWNPTALHLKGYVRGQATSPAYVNTGYYVVWDRQPNRALATQQDVFVGTAPSFMYPAPSTDDRFLIIHHKIFNVVVPDAGVVGDKSQFIVDDYIKLPARLTCHAALGSSAGGINDRVSGALLLFVYSSEGVASIARPQANLAHRIYFNDV